VVVTDPGGLEQATDRPVIFLGNHQVGIESLLFSIIASTLVSRPTVTIAKDEHRSTWLGRLIELCFEWPGARDPGVIRYFDRARAESMAELLEGLASELKDGTRALMVHVEGTRSTQARQPVQQLSGAFLDLALQVGAVVVPVRFSGGLPVEPVDERLEFPVGFGKQDLWFGEPILPETLQALPLKARKEHVLDALNTLGPPLDEEQPHPGDQEFAEAVETRSAEQGVARTHAAILEALRRAELTSEPAARLVSSLETGRLEVSSHEPQDAWLKALAMMLLGEAALDVLHEV
jgi:1-acyl-sn-glycerol-3-phosphate acyltransferase